MADDAGDATPTAAADDTSSGVYARGMEVRRRVLGDDHVDRAIAGVTDMDRRFQRWITESAWGTVWAGDTFDDRTRSIVTIAILAALGREELDLHLRASAGTGVTEEEIAEVMMHVGVYAGVPAANHAMARAKQIRGGGEHG
ncbi:MAG TPA: 4-carboxymuconolactone decarboxylase [Euzebya sp.]|nr:4-carboxymuconolactone decarboxylase [Euzebya sp.]